jgi:hypothetical protein
VQEIGIIGTFYDGAGLVVAVTLGLPDKSPLAPGEASPFTLVVQQPKGISIQDFALQAEVP